MDYDRDSALKSLERAAVEALRCDWRHRFRILDQEHRDACDAGDKETAKQTLNGLAKLCKEYLKAPF